MNSGRAPRRPWDMGCLETSRAIRRHDQLATFGMAMRRAWLMGTPHPGTHLPSQPFSNRIRFACIHLFAMGLAFPYCPGFEA